MSALSMSVSSLGQIYTVRSGRRVSRRVFEGTTSLLEETLTTMLAASEL